MGENFVVSQIVPLLKTVVRSCIDTSSTNNPEPVQSWNSLALVDCLFVFNGLIAMLQKEVVVKELLEVLVQVLVPAGEDGKGQVIAHRAHRLLAVQRHRRHHELGVFLGVAEGLLAVEQGDARALRPLLVALHFVELDPDALDPLGVRFR